jgi:protein TonB
LVVLERPSEWVSWVLAVGVFCLAVGVVGLGRPVGEVGREVAPMGAPLGEEALMLDLAGGEAALGEGAAAAAEVGGAEVAAEEMPEPAVALEVDDVFVVPAAVPVEPLVQERRERRAEPAPRVAARTTPARGTGNSGGGGTVGRPTGTAQGTGTGAGGGGGTAGAGRGRTTGYFPTPPYPAQARSRGQQGTVQLMIDFAADGRVTRATVSRSSGYTELDRTAAAWVRRHWRAASGQVGTFRLPVHFKLR